VSGSWFKGLIETLSHSFVCKPIYLRLYRRSYKRANTDRHYSNEYDVALRGVKMVPEPEILNYFRRGLTNAKAENLNGKLQRFISANYGLKNKDFFLYRTAGYFS
jgi:hypothetical protein